ncbi:hypothetical protein GO988_08275 [Hymenobacter sp. HMF4947]|uniref:Uncharacterized protein n=1 Tax=Hymenobacter ginkgonis TaxID=2682976 RepID=A0A7K1TD50_9BACT|nr:hypothetical protein [Hymenobacter ginkgonis]MVN76319.1 hypothetical protein [Hymenobacter ginkgonis]
MATAPASEIFSIRSSFRVPGLGLLVLPAAPAAAWLAAQPLHTVLGLALHRPGQPPLPLPGTIEELAHADEPPTRALLLDADPGELPAGAYLEVGILEFPHLF